MPPNDEKQRYEQTKAWLRRFQYTNEDLKSLQVRLETLRDKAYTPAAPILSDMPRGGSGPRDKIGNSVAVLDLLEREMAKQQQVAAEIYLEIDAAIKKIQGRGNAQRRLVLQLRYLDLLPWDEISFTLFGGETDFSEREQSYNRRCLDLHKNGVLELMEITEILKED